MRETTRQEPSLSYPGNKNALNLLCALALLLTVLVSPLMAQSGASWVFQDEKLTDVLQKISEAESINFSYDAGDPLFEKRISYDSRGESVNDMVAHILSMAGLQYKKIGNQMVIVRKPEEFVPREEVIGAEPPPVNESIAVEETPVPITEYLLDTVYLRDTIVRIDTVRTTDTVFVEKEKPAKQPAAKVKELPVDFFQQEAIRDKGWALSVFAAPVLDDFSLVEGDRSYTLHSFSIGVDALKLRKRWNLSFGLRLTQFNQKFVQQYSHSEGGFFAADTVDAYYTVVDFDTTWYFVTDSSWVPLEVSDYSYQRTNTLGYAELNVSASFDLYQNQKWRVYVKAGGQLDLLIYNSGLAIFGDNQEEAADFADIDLHNLNFTITAGAGIKYRLADKADFMSEFYYMRYMSELAPDFPQSTQFNAFGLKLGFIFYF